MLRSSFSWTLTNHADESTGVRWRHVHNAKRRLAHIDRAVDPGNWDFLDIVAGQQRLQAGLDVSREVIFLDIDALENLRFVKLQIVRGITHAQGQEHISE